MSQCTFWCSVLSDGEYWLRYGYAISVSMHLLVLSAFRRRVQFVSKQVRIVSMHLLVLSAFRLTDAISAKSELSMSQCTFWCSVLSDQVAAELADGGGHVSMHLLVLSAFRLEQARRVVFRDVLSQCTFWCSVLSDYSDVP